MMNYYLPQYAGGGIAGLASQGRGGDTMLVHMSPQEVMDLQKVARSQGTTMTINPVTGLPEALNLRRRFEGLLLFYLWQRHSFLGLVRRCRS
jgi:hypothetical protein